MTIPDIEDITNILQGYDSWRERKAHPAANDTSVSAYLDEFAKLRAVETIDELRLAYADRERTWQEIDADVRRILGVV